MSLGNWKEILLSKSDEDCLACRLISGFGVIGIGVYLNSIALTQKTAINKRGMQLIALGNNAK